MSARDLLSILAELPRRHEGGFVSAVSRLILGVSDSFLGAKHV